MDEANKDYYQANLEKYMKELDETTKYIQDRINEIPEGSRYLVTAHDAFGYFSKQFGLKVESIQGVSTDSEVSTKRIEELAQFIADNKIKAIFTESSVSPASIHALEEAVKAKGWEIKIGDELYSDSRSNMKVIEIEKLVVAYDEDKPVLDGFNLGIEKGKMTAFVGPNGAGKSTLIKAILEFVKPITGSIKINGKTYAQEKKKIAYVPQRGSVDWDFPTTLYDVVEMGSYGRVGFLKRVPKSEKKRVMEAIEKVDMIEYIDRQISQLSGGQQQRVFIARALVQDAEIYLLDEPFQGIDKKTEGSIVNILKGLKEEGKTVIVVHHDLQTVPEYFDEVVLINRKVIASGKVSEVFTKENIDETYKKSMDM